MNFPSPSSSFSFIHFQRFPPAASGDWANDILACKLSSSPTAVQASPIKTSAGRRIIIVIVVVVVVMSFFSSTSRLGALFLHCFQPFLCRLASSFPCLVELGIGQNLLLTDSSLSSVARSTYSCNKMNNQIINLLLHSLTTADGLCLRIDITSK